MGAGEVDPGQVSDSPSSREDRSRRLSVLWKTDREGVSVDLLRCGLGLVWCLNLLFVLDPANQFFSTFEAVTLSFGPTTLGGPGIANFVAANAVVFSWITAGLTAYLAAAFLLGMSTRLACILGGIASLLFLITQFTSTFSAPGGTDVGAHPLYLLSYLILFVGGAGRYYAVDHWLWIRGGARFPRLLRILFSPR
jgi:uncharacterized membrane protein YphA (DoxX/SURF4 family)